MLNTEHRKEYWLASICCHVFRARHRQHAWDGMGWGTGGAVTSVWQGVSMYSVQGQ